MGPNKLGERIKYMRQLISGILFIAGATRLDIQYAVDYVSRCISTSR
jgi:hypothetical protein